VSFTVLAICIAVLAAVVVAAVILLPRAGGD
jgi:hypothetical protein